MLLLELIGSIPIAHRKVNIPRIQNVKLLGAGQQGFAQLHARHPNSIIKIALLQDHNDAYEDFIRTAIYRGKTNPYFPRIKSAKKYRINPINVSQYQEMLKQLGISNIDEDVLKNAKWMLIVVMEKLVPIIRPDIEHAIVSQLKYLYGPVLLNRVIPQGSYYDIYELVDILQDPSFLQIIQETTPDPLFKQALKSVRALIFKHSGDISVDNIMARLDSSKGAQIVFIDPVWQKIQTGK